MSTPYDLTGDTRGYERGRRKRAEILDAALQLFGEVGYRSASLRDLAHRVGITHPGLLHHFPTKKDLLSAVLARRDEVDMAEHDAALAAGLDWVDALVALVERNQQRPLVVELHTSLSAEATTPDHPAHAFFVRRYADVLDRIREVFTDRAAEGRLRPGLDPDTAARLLIAAMDGLQVQWLLERGQPERVDMAAAIRALLDTMLLPAAD